LTHFARRSDGQVAFLLATKNEFEALSFVVSELIEVEESLGRLVTNIRLVIVDDSDDHEISETKRRLTEQLADNGSIIELSVRAGPGAGLSRAVLDGFRFIDETAPDSWVINLDGDGQHDIRAAPDLLRLAIATHTHCVIGSRWARGGSAPGLGFTRRVISRSAISLLHRCGIPKKVKDPTTSFRCYHPAATREILRELRGFDGFAFFPASLALIASLGMPVAEVPIVFRPRVAGTSKLSFSVLKTTMAQLPRIWSISRMARKRVKWFRAGTTEQYIGADELFALRSATGFQHYVANISSPAQVGKSLEIGAGIGASAEALLNANGMDPTFHLTLFEPDPSLREKLLERTSRCAIKTTIVDSLDGLPRGAFEHIFMYSVLEHIGNDVEFLTHISEFLTPDGKLVLFVPRMPSIFGTVDGSSGHFRRYDKASIRSVLTASGLEAELISPVDVLGWFPYWITYSVFKRRRIARSAVQLNDKILLPITKFADRLPLFPRIASKNFLIHAVCTHNSSRSYGSKPRS